ncbi:hypothetical protein PanWU01x14_122860 [Parasponia andersonii]|uniref:Zinc finger, CCHC-type n=1 Tax=Parasponia andersonii TaxID=3476 RepID=A0A2P5CU43_PARAD|nr:hypothetical protein PanWU01x14_122860 [Parasponia andersonii]
MAITEFFQKMKNTAENLAVTGQFIREDDLVLYRLACIVSEYDSVVVNVTSHHDALALQEVYSLPLNHENRLEQHSVAANIELHIATANVVTTGGERQGGTPGPQENRGGFSHVNGHRGGRGGRGNGCHNKPTCQVCGKIGYTAAICFDGAAAAHVHDPKQISKPYLMNILLVGRIFLYASYCRLIFFETC